MAQAQTIPADFLAASLSMRDLLEGLHEDIAALSMSSAEAYQGLKDSLLQSWEKLPVVINEYKQSVQNMPRELRQRVLVKGIFKDVESFEKDVRQFFAELGDFSFADAYRNALQSRTDQLAQQIAALEENALVQKFLRGEVVLSSKKSIQWGRKFVHTALGISFLYLFVYSGLSTIATWSIAGPLVFGALVIEVTRHRYPRVNQWACKFFKPMMREREKTRITAATFYIMAMAIVYFVFPIEVAILTMLFIAIGDTVAGIVGVYWGRRKLSEHATLEGSLACFATCALAAAVCATFLFDKTLSFLPLILFSTLSGLVGAIAEASLQKLDDNLVMPLLSAPVLWVLMKFFALI
jgi:dolichol kinase